MKTPMRVLVVSKSEKDRDAVLRELNQSEYEVTSKRVEAAEAVSAALLEQTWDVVISGDNIPRLSVQDILRLIWEHDVDMPLVLITDNEGEQYTINAIKSGVDECIPRNNLKRLVPVIEKELYLAETRREHRRAEAALRESSEFQDTLLTNSPNAITVANPDTSLRYVNPAMEKLSGFSASEVIDTKAPYPWWPKEKHAEYLAALERAMQSGSVRPERQFHKKNGDSVFVEINSAPIKEGNKVKYHLTNYIDITERKKAQQEIQQHIERLRKSVEQTVQAMALISEVRDPYNAGHQRRVTRICAEIAREMGLPETQIMCLRLAALVHDIGKIHVPSEILSKPSQLTTPEFDMIRAHSQVGYDILKTIDFPWPIAQIVLQHHERLDGSGYPAGLSGDKIPLEARILAVADVVEAMSSHRPYRPAHGMDKALLEIIQKRGVLYDPKVVDACLRLFSEKGFTVE